MPRAIVITPPEPIVTPADIAGAHAADDAGVAAIIQAVTEEIDGPDGWLGLCLGEQTLQLSLEGWPCDALRLPCGPILSIESIRYLDRDNAEIPVAAPNYSLRDGILEFDLSWSKPSLSRRTGPIRIRYVAGHDGEAIDDGGTGELPDRARLAIILATQHLISLGGENLFLRSEEVEGIGVRQYTVSSQASDLIQRACTNLLSGLRVFS
jgi:hypothetical protein